MTLSVEHANTQKDELILQVFIYKPYRIIFYKVNMEENPEGSMDISAAGELANWSNEISILHPSGYFTPSRTDLEMEIKPLIRILFWKNVETVFKSLLETSRPLPAMAS